MSTPKGFWKSKNGVMRSIASLDPGHLTNCIALVGRMIDSAQDGIDAFEPFGEHDFDFLDRLVDKLAVLSAKQDELVAEKCLRIDHECEECDGTGKAMTWLDGMDRYTSNSPCTFCDGKGYYIPSELRDFPPQKNIVFTGILSRCVSWQPKPPLQATYRDPELYNAAKDWYFKTQVKT